VISETYGFKSISVLPPQPLPKSALSEAAKRYRAGKLLDYLDGIRANRFTKVIGLTTVDISATKGQYDDWGIFGIANQGGPVCIVSTYRLGKGKVDDRFFMLRVKKVIMHEVGHMLGLPHCPNPWCVMRDANGKIATFDQSEDKLCRNCRRSLGLPPEGIGRE
jgi:archaemetzincin